MDGNNTLRPLLPRLMEVHNETMESRTYLEIIMFSKSKTCYWNSIVTRNGSFHFQKSSIVSPAPTGLEPLLSYNISLIGRRARQAVIAPRRITWNTVQNMWLINASQCRVFSFVYTKISNFVKRKCANFVKMTLMFIKYRCKIMFIFMKF